MSFNVCIKTIITTYKLYFGCSIMINQTSTSLIVWSFNDQMVIGTISTIKTIKYERKN